MRSSYTHSFHPYPAKFPADVIRPYIQKYSRSGGFVIDPFCGSGTTLVECRLLGRNALGIDSNPVGVLMSKAKAEKYSKTDLASLQKIIAALDEAAKNIDAWIKKNYRQEDLPSYPRRDEWFGEQARKELGAIKSGIIRKYESSEQLHALLLTAFSRIIVPASFQDTETRYARVEKEIPPGYVLDWYRRTLKSYFETLTNQMLTDDSVITQVIEGDAVQALSTVKDSSVDLVVTSPPYINSFDYYLYHKHRIYWLDKSPQSVRHAEIGCHHKIDTQTSKKAVEEYISAMTDVFVELHRVLKDGKHIVLFIGDGIVKGDVVDISKVIKEIATRSDLSIVSIDSSPLHDVSKRFIKDHRIHKKKHHVIILKK